MMDYPLQHFPLWARTLGPTDQPDLHRERLRTAFDKFRNRVAQLVQSLGAEVPGLTVHDITHLDAFWRIADQIAGSNYPINPAEAFVFGGAALLHDAAHVIAAYPGGLATIKDTVQWQDLIAQQYGNNEPPAGSPSEKIAIFHILRQLHAEQAHKLPSIEWSIPGTIEKVELLEDLELRLFYGDLIGEIAESHHWPAQRVSDNFRTRVVAPPSFLNTEWKVDVLKIALLLRVSDAAHLDDQRAPWFLFALGQPTGISADHWRFQAKIGQPICDNYGQILLSAGAPFHVHEKSAWWLAYDTACMIDRELKDAASILKEEGRHGFRATGVTGVELSTTFARYVRVSGWEPVNIAPKVSSVTSLIHSLGGVALYGNDLSAPLREILQNSMNAIRAARSLGVLDPNEGHIEVSLKKKSESHWVLQVTDTGIGMSRFVLTNVLLDFGKSLWKSDVLREELPGLARTGFSATGKFGIGFYSVFMLGEQIQVTTRRFEKSDVDSSDQWSVIFDSGLNGRPMLIKTSGSDRLAKHGTRVTVEISNQNLNKLLKPSNSQPPWIEVKEAIPEDADHSDEYLAKRLARLCPASDVRIRIRTAEGSVLPVVEPSDWLVLPDDELNARIQSSKGKLFPIYNDDGAIIGRVAPSSSILDNDDGSIVYNGIVCGSINGLSGICWAKNNNFDAKRTGAQVGGTREQWSAWARRVIEGTDRISPSVYRRLHRLLPDEDFPIWSVGGEEMTLAVLTEKVKSFDSVLVHEGDIDYDDYFDDFGRSSFDNDFSVLPTVVCCPERGRDPSQRFTLFHPGGDFSWSLQGTRIDYEKILVNSLKMAWGDVEIMEDDTHVVGDAGGADVERTAFVVKRKTTNK
jgi:hypothetical protein